MFDKIKSSLHLDYPKEEFNSIFKKLQEHYPTGEDPWGLNLKKTYNSLKYVYPIYQKYFKVRVFGSENVNPNSTYLIASNHSGQVAMDGMLICAAFLLDVDPPRVLRPMVERFVPSIPWFGTWSAEGGAVLGDRKNCLNLLNRNQSVLVFPEGVRGVAKNSADYYQLQRFTRGFFRMALAGNVEILPLAVVGAEEMFPWVYHPKALEKFLGIPALPLSPNYFPLPSPVDIHIGKPYSLPDISSESPDRVIDEHIKIIQGEITKLTKKGLKKRRAFWANHISPKTKDR